MTDNITIDPNTATDRSINIDPNALPAPTAMSPLAPGQGNRIAPEPTAPAPQPKTVPLFGPDGQLYDVPSEKSHDAVIGGGMVASPIIAPDGSHLFVPANKLHDALKAGAKIDDTGWTPEQEKLNHPSLAQRAGGVIAGPGTIGGDIKDRWNAATPAEGDPNAPYVPSGKVTPMGVITPADVHEELSKSIISPVNAMTPEERKDHPILADILERVGGLSSPENMAMLFASEGLGTLAGSASELAAKVVPRLVSAGFSIQQIIGAAKESGEAWEAIKRGDESEALKLITHVVGDIAMAALAAQHFAGVEAAPSTIVGKRLQAPVDAAAARVSQAFKSDTSAMASASAAHRSASAVFDQRLNENNTMADQAVRASQAVDQAKIDFANGKITQQQLDDANTAASKAASNARKATQALSDAHEAQARAGAEVDRMNRKIQKSGAKVSTKADKDVAKGRDQFRMLAPPTTSPRGAYTEKDEQIFHGYAEKEHENEPITSVKDYIDAAQKISNDMDNKVAESAAPYMNEPLSGDVLASVRDELAKSKRTDFVEKGMDALETLENIDNPTVADALELIKQLNAEMRKQAKDAGGHSTAMLADASYAAKAAAQSALRSGLFDTLEEHDVNGIRELRSDQASIIKVKYALEAQRNKGDRTVRGSGQSGPISKLLRKTSGALGAAAGGTLGVVGGGFVAGPVGAEVLGTVGAGAGAMIGDRIGRGISPGDMTKDQLAAQSAAVKGKGVATTEVTGTGVSPIPHDFTPLHAELAAHVAPEKSIGETKYDDLEKEFMDRIADKTRRGAPLEPDEKSLVKKIKAQQAAELLQAMKEAQQKAQEAAAKGVPLAPTATLPENAEPVQKVNSRGQSMPNGRSDQEALVHDIAHKIVAKMLGIKTVDGIRSDSHPENVAAGSLLSAPIDWSEFMNADGTRNTAKIEARAADLVATYIAGIVVDEDWHGIHTSRNQGGFADLGVINDVFGTGKNGLGFSKEKIAQLITTATDTVRQITSQPGVREVIEQHASVREPGQDKQHHFSEERMDQIHQDVQNVIGGKKNEGTEGTGNDRGASKGVSGGREGNAPGGKGTVKEEGAAELRPTGEGPATGKARAVREAEPAGTEGSREAVKGAADIESPKLAANYLGNPRAASMRDEPVYKNNPDLFKERYGSGQEWYHGTTADFTNFAHEGVERGTTDWNSKLGTHFAADDSTAQDFAEGKYSGKTGGKVIPAKLKIQNPKIYQFEGDMGDDALKSALKNNIVTLDDVRKVRPDFDPNQTYHEGNGIINALRNKRDRIGVNFKNDLKSQGHDGIIYGNVVEGGFGSPAAIAFEPSQIERTDIAPESPKLAKDANKGANKETKPHAGIEALGKEK
jgi:hypothetical protein